MKVRTRIAPSPTGPIHVGTLRAALFNYIYAEKYGGEMVLRIEDTDIGRSKREYEQEIDEALVWLGLSYTEKVRQSERTEMYTKYLEKLIASNLAYISREESTQEPGKMVEVIRLRNPGVLVSFKDVVRDTIQFDTSELGDFVIARSISEPLYHFAVVVDDYEMNITHVIRGEDHISNTPRQILIQEALGFPRPVYAHLPLLLAADKSKLSKRKHTTSVHSFIEMGILPEAMQNYLALLGWNPKEDVDLLSMDELITRFELEDVQKGGAVFDLDRLLWFNRQYLLQTDEEELYAMIAPHFPEVSQEVLKRALPTVLERIHVAGEIPEEKAKGEYNWLTATTLTVDPGLLLWKGMSEELAKQHLEHLKALLEPIPEREWGLERIREGVWAYAEAEGKGEVLWPFRVALSGQGKSPDPFSLAYILGKNMTLHRIENAVSAVS